MAFKMNEQVRAKKHLGQHFLKDESIALDIVKSLKHTTHYKKVLEVGPGMGVLTKYLIAEPAYETHIIDIDRDSIAYLKQHYPVLENKIIEGDFLKLDFNNLFNNEPFAVIGNFPYNISSQILFKILKHRDQVSLIVGMFQKEVAERISSKPKKKSYGILSVFMQTFYTVEYILEVPPSSFKPVPKVNSAVLQFTRNEKKSLNCDEKKFFLLIKTAFNQRRKTLRNALKNILPAGFPSDLPVLNKRAEELSASDFESLAGLIEKG